MSSCEPGDASGSLLWPLSDEDPERLRAAVGFCIRDMSENKYI